jgi:thiamine-phosphate pyrophosphorylase
VHQPYARPADRLATARLYLCTDARRERGDLAQFVDAALAGGVDIVQLRDKGSAGEQRFGPLEARDELAACEILADAARRHGALFAVNDRADIARAAGADVLHLGQGDLPPSVAREIVGPDTLIGLSTHDAGQVAAAGAGLGAGARAGAGAGAADYFCVGPCWPTPTKPGRAAPGLQLVRAAAELGGDKPWFAIGGIDAHRLPYVLDAGARRIVVVRAITAAEDPRAAAEQLSSALAAAS